MLRRLPHFSLCHSIRSCSSRLTASHVTAGFTAGRVSRIAPSALLLAFGLASGLAAPSRAQQGDIGQIATQTAVVLDFDVAPGLDPILGRKAADAVAVEMAASGNFTITPRQTVEEAVASRPGLRGPYVPSTQRRLGESLGVQSVISGRVVAASVGSQVTRTQGRERQAITTQMRAARVQIQLRQMEVRSGDFVNGTQVTETTVDELREVDDDVLMNQSLDKAAFSAVRTIRLIIFPEGTVLNIVGSDNSGLGGSIQLNIGFDRGVRPGQRFSVLRDVANKSRGANEANVFVERIKVAELLIVRIEPEQSIATVVAGGSVGVRTGDKVRRIFAPGTPFTEPSFERLEQPTRR